MSPNATELCNNFDDNCNNAVDEGFDMDGDGYTVCNGDCDDNSALSNPNAIELCNSGDDNCNGIADEGFDVDGDGFTSCNGDCNDQNAAMNPTITEICNGLDDNCNGLADEGLTTPWYSDLDGDGYGAGVASYFCIQPVGMVTNDADCNDANPAINPSAIETLDNIDNDCDGFIDEGASDVAYNLDLVKLMLMPNPAKDQVVIVTDTHIGKVSVMVYDAQTRLVDQFQYTGARHELNLATYSDGIYQMVFQTENGFGMKRLVVEK
jgi:hypothetical protein